MTAINACRRLFAQKIHNPHKFAYLRKLSSNSAFVALSSAMDETNGVDFVHRKPNTIAESRRETFTTKYQDVRRKHSMDVTYMRVEDEGEVAREQIVFFLGDSIQQIITPSSAEVLIRLSSSFGIVKSLASKVPSTASIVIIGPDHYDNGCFAVYNQFIPHSTKSGEPLGYNPTGLQAAKELSCILKAVTVEAGGSSRLGDDCCPITLIGFSKGGILLNQLLTELASILLKENDGQQGFSHNIDNDNKNKEEQKATGELLKRIRCCHYVDVGLNSRGAYLTDPRILQPLANRCLEEDNNGNKLKIVLHGTPRQWSCKSRKWIGDEKNRMVAILSKAGYKAPVHEYTFGGRKPDLEMHFEVIDAMQLDI